MSVIAGAAAVPHALNMLPAAAAVAVLCGLAIAEIAALPGVLLPGGTMTLLAGALIGAGRPALVVAVPVAAAVEDCGLPLEGRVSGCLLRHRRRLLPPARAKAYTPGALATTTRPILPSINSPSQRGRGPPETRLRSVRQCPCSSSSRTPESGPRWQ